MADKYSTIQQHQPLRQPASFDSQGKALVVQLDEIFDDIYRRFGRIRMQDLGDALVQVITDKYGNVNGITIDEDGVEIESNAGEHKHVKIFSGNSIMLLDPAKIQLESGEVGNRSVVIIDPSQINMNTPGLIVLQGSGLSVIKLYDSINGEVFTATPENGITAQKAFLSNLRAPAAEIENLTVGNIDLPQGTIPNIVWSETQPAAGNGTIWLEPQTSGSGTAEAFSGSVGVKAADAHACTKSGSTFSYKTSLQNSISLEDVKKIWFSGKINRNGADLGLQYTVNVDINCTDGSVIHLGDVGTYTTGGDHNLSFPEPSSNNYNGAAKTAKSITYNLVISGTDAMADYSSFYAGTLRYSGEHSGSTITSDVCTVHYIP